MSIELRTSTWDDFPLVKIINARGENGYRTQSDFDAHQLVFTPDRSIMAFDGNHMVGNALSYEMDMYIPGGVSKIAAVASVLIIVTFIGILFGTLIQNKSKKIIEEIK